MKEGPSRQEERHPERGPIEHRREGVARRRLSISSPSAGISASPSVCAEASKTAPIAGSWSDHPEMLREDARSSARPAPPPNVRPREPRRSERRASAGPRAARHPPRCLAGSGRSADDGPAERLEGQDRAICEDRNGPAGGTCGSSSSRQRFASVRRWTHAPASRAAAPNLTPGKRWASLPRRTSFADSQLLPHPRH